MKLTYEDEDKSFSLSCHIPSQDVDCGDMGWLFGEVIRVCGGGRKEHAVAEIIANLDEDFAGTVCPDIDDARARLVQAAYDLKAAWERHDERIGLARRPS